MQIAMLRASLNLDTETMKSKKNNALGNSCWGVVQFLFAAPDFRVLYNTLLGN
jgi:hypothetical protein